MLIGTHVKCFGKNAIITINNNKIELKRKIRSPNINENSKSSKHQPDQQQVSGSFCRNENLTERQRFKAGLWTVKQKH